MPRRIVIRTREAEEGGKEAPIIEPVVEGRVQAEKPVEAIDESVLETKPHVMEEDKEIREAEIDAETSYDALRKKIEEIRTREKVTQQKFKDQPDMSISILKKILQKWDVLREEVRRSISEEIEKYKRLKSLYEAKFSRIEEELYFNQIELDTIRQLEEQGEPISVSKKEELERMIPELVRELTTIDSKTKEIDARIEQLKQMLNNIYEVTSYKELSSRLFDEMVSMLEERLGSDTVPKLRAQIDSIAQREGLPREYATIYVWKKLKRS